MRKWDSGSDTLTMSSIVMGQFRLEYKQNQRQIKATLDKEGLSGAKTCSHIEDMWTAFIKTLNFELTDQSVASHLNISSENKNVCILKVYGGVNKCQIPRKLNGGFLSLIS